MTDPTATPWAGASTERDALHVPSIGEILREVYPSFPSPPPEAEQPNTVALMYTCTEQIGNSEECRAPAGSERLCRLHADQRAQWYATMDATRHADAPWKASA